MNAAKSADDLLRDRIRGRVEKRGTCLVWLGARAWGPKGQTSYGVMRVGGKLVLVRRLAYRLAKGEPGKNVVRATCGDSLCCNPRHLVLSSRKKSSGRRKGVA